MTSRRRSSTSSGRAKPTSTAAVAGPVSASPSFGSSRGFSAEPSRSKARRAGAPATVILPRDLPEKTADPETVEAAWPVEARPRPKRSRRGRRRGGSTTARLRARADRRARARSGRRTLGNRDRGRRTAGSGSPRRPDAGPGRMGNAPQPEAAPRTRNIPVIMLSVVENRAFVCRSAPSTISSSRSTFPGSSTAFRAPGCSLRKDTCSSSTTTRTSDISFPGARRRGLPRPRRGGGRKRSPRWNRRSRAASCSIS